MASSIRLGPGDARHGSYLGYVNHHCECESCRAAWAAYTSQQRANRPPLSDGDARHGLNGYHNYRCRCPVCSDAAATYRFDRKHVGVH